MEELASEAWEASSASEGMPSPSPLPPVVTSPSINAAFDIADSASEAEDGAEEPGLRLRREMDTGLHGNRVASDLSSPSLSVSSSESPAMSPQRRPRAQTHSISLTQTGGGGPAALGHWQFGAPVPPDHPSASSPAIFGVGGLNGEEAAADDDVDQLASWYSGQKIGRSTPGYALLNDGDGYGSGDSGSSEMDGDPSEHPSGEERPRDSAATSAAAFSSLASSRLKKGWRAVKRSSQKSTASAVKTTASASRRVSSMSSSYWKAASASSASTSRDPKLPMTPEERTAWEERQSELCSEWMSSIIPGWKKKRSSARVRSLVFRGIPPSVRGRAWLVAMGNPLNITSELFSVLKDRAHDGRMEFLRSRDTLDKADGDVGGHGGRAEPMLKEERNAHKSIMLDLPRTFPELAFFHADGSPYEDSLREVLEAFMYLRPDIGYSQGMSFLAAVLLLYIDDTADAFTCFANMLLHKSCFLHFYSMKMPEVRIYLSMHDRLMREEMPTLHAHFQKQSVNADLYMINWVMSLYCGALPLDLVTRIWDIYMLDGDVAIFRAALGILKLLQPQLLTMGFEGIAYLLSHVPQGIDAEELLRSVRSVRTVTRARFKECFRSCSARHAAAAAAAAAEVQAAAQADAHAPAGSDDGAGAARAPACADKPNLAVRLS